MAETLQTLSYTSFILAVVFFALAAAFFFIFDVRAIIGELTGKTATTAIAKIRKQGIVRKYKGRTLQSIVLEGKEYSADFSLEKLSFGKEEESLSERATCLLALEEVSEEGTVLLAGKTSKEASKETSDAVCEEASEKGTALLGAQASEEGTALLGQEATEAATTLLGEKRAK